MEDKSICGIIGCVGRTDYKIEKAIKFMLCLDTLRGEDSTGLMSVYHDKKVRFVKDVGTPWDLISNNSADFNNVFYGNAGAFIGHNRAATKGKIEAKNAHPFIFDKFAGVHNGTLDHQYNLDDYKDFDVDSENLYHHMNNNGVVETLKTIKGAFSLAYYDAEAHTVQLVNNGKRPMTFAFTKDNKTVIFASEGWMIAVACARAGVEIFEVNEAKEGKLYTFPVPDCVADKFEGYEKKWTEESVEFYKAPANNNNNYKGWYNDPRKERDNVDYSWGSRRARNGNYEAQRGAVLMFEFVGIQSDGNNTRFLEVRTQKDDLTGRLYLAQSNPKFYSYLSSTSYFKGRVGGVGKDARGDQFLTFTPDSIEEVKTDLSNHPLMVKKYELQDGSKGTMQEWLDACGKAGGCARCNRLPLVSEHEGQIWLGEEEFICSKCADSITVIDAKTGD